MVKTLLLSAATAVIGLVALSAQAPDPNLKFEVASIRLMNEDGNVTGRGGGPNLTTGGSYFNHSGQIYILIQQAYQVPPIRLLGGPAWMRSDSDPYRISAKVPDGVERTPENMRTMIKALLVDRFKLVVHEEEREVPVYALVFARADKAFGPKLRPFPAAHCQATPSDPECASRLGSPSLPTATSRTIRARNTEFERVAPFLTNIVGRPIIDRTELTGRYDWDVTFAPEAAVAAGPSELPSLFTALQEQVGLKLQPERAPMRVVVVDSIARPTEN